MIRRLCLALCLAASAASAAERLAVAATVNLGGALDALNTAFRTAHPDTEIATTTGASGVLCAQIEAGAPFDVFLSADVDYARQLVADGFGVDESLRKFATGKLVLWSTRESLDLRDLAEALRSPALKILASAQPKTAPYGSAAQAALATLGLTAIIQPKLLLVENCLQAAQLVEHGQADAGLVPLSLVLSVKPEARGRWIEVPSRLHATESLEHTGVLTKSGASKPAAKRYLDFLGSEPAKKILETFGYSLPQ